MASEGGVRLQAWLARRGVASRRACEELIAQGRVRVDGELVSSPGFKVAPGQRVELDGREVGPAAAMRYVALNKPPKYLCSSSDPRGRPLAIGLLPPVPGERLYSVGRLDFMSQGLLLFTNDGDFAARIMHPSSGIEKEYLVEAVGAIPASLLADFRSGVDIEGVRYRALRCDPLSPRRARVVLVEGKNREIRRVFERAGIEVASLTRLRIGPIELGGLPQGGCRELGIEEREALLREASKGGGHGDRD